MFMGEIATLVKYNLPVNVIVIKNNVLGEIKWEQMILGGNPDFGVELEPIDFETLAEACGAPASRSTGPKDAENPEAGSSSSRSHRCAGSGRS